MTPAGSRHSVAPMNVVKKILLLTLLFVALIALALGGWAVDAMRKLRFPRSGLAVRPA
jgi:sensor domain CHASE-containing protein